MANGNWYPKQKIKIMPKSISLDDYIISDTHLGHKNIIKYCGRPMNHETLIIDNWNKVVKSTDTIFHLGDVTVFYGKDQEAWEKTCAGLPGKKKLILGNHDQQPTKYYKKLGFEVISPFICEVETLRILFSHYPTFHMPDDNWDLNIHGHSHTHKKKRWSEWHINVSVEHMKYSPTTLREILK